MNKEILKAKFDKEKEKIVFKNYINGKTTIEFLRLNKSTVENPVIIENYPYGFSQRTKIKYYIEETKRGNRFVSQTLNPKTELWNNPKKSTYCDVMVLIGDENGHITYLSCSINDDKSKAEAFLIAFKTYINEEQKKALCRIVGWDKVMEKVSFSVQPETDYSPEEKALKDKEQDQIMAKIRLGAKVEATKRLMEAKK